MALKIFLRSTPLVLSFESVFHKIFRKISTTHIRLITERRYTKKHEWVCVENNVGTVGITCFAQEALGDIVYVELPDVDSEIAAGDSVGAVESVKAASDIYSPVSGKVMEKNCEVEENPALINKSPYDEGWLFKLKLSKKEELNELMDEVAYNAFKKMDEENAH